MISPAEIQHWRSRVPWTSADQVEQDLILARLMIEIANDPLLGEELVMRGGTCFHMLWLDQAWRYSEDLDYVRRTDGPIGPIFDALRSIANRVGFDKTSTAVGRHPKLHMRSTFASGNPLRVKVEMNTFERLSALAPTTRALAVDSPWFEGSAEVPTFAIEELAATKIRAIYQRTKGRDLFDLWLTVHLASIEPAAIAACFAPYRPDGWTPARALENLDAKLNDEAFTTDIEGLLINQPNGYNTNAAAGTVREIIESIRKA